MEQHRAIPAGYMRIGEIAKSAGVTVRTLQHYDKEGLLKPSAESEGGFRLYTDKDTARLAQILMMKELGFSLSEIKKRLTSLDTTGEFVNLLTEQASQIRNKIAYLTESLEAIEILKDEVEQMETVDFKKFAAILFAIQTKMEQYWLIKHFDIGVPEAVEARLGKEAAYALAHEINVINARLSALSKEGCPPGSEKAQELISLFWEKLMEFSGGDMEIIHKLNTQTEKAAETDEKWGGEIEATQRFAKAAITIYFERKEGAQDG